MRQVAILSTLLAATTAGAQSTTNVKSADYAFSYSYPAEAARVPALRTWLDADRAAVRAKLARDAASGRADAKRSGYPFHPYEAQTSWKLVTETPRFVSLSGQVYTFSNGAHGYTGSTATVWDKAQRRRFAPKDAFALPALETAIAPSYCAQLKAQRAQRLGEAVGPGDVFAKCPPLKDLTVLLGSSDGQRINRIGLIADPYVAGSYAEGPYEVTLPVTPVILRTVKPAYRAGFAIK